MTAAVVASDSVSQIVNTLLNFGANDSLLTDLGGRLLLYLTVIAIAWAAIKILFEQEGIQKFVAELVMIIFLWGFASLFLSGIGDGGWGKKLMDGFDWVAKEIVVNAGAAGGERIEDPAQSIMIVLGNTVEVAMKLFSDKDMTGEKAESSIGLITMSAAEFFYWILHTLMRLATLLFVMVATILYIGQFVFTQIMVKIGFLLMPIMVPFLLLDKTRFVFDGWLKFMISAGFIKIVGAFLYGLMIGNVNEAVEIARTATASESNAVAFYVYSALLLLTGIMAFIMAQAQSIGNALTSGIASGGFSFKTPQVKLPRLNFPTKK